MVELVELDRRDRLELEKAFGEFFDARRVVELAPLGAQARDLVALVADLGAQLGEALGLQGGIEFDAVDVGGGEHQRADYQQIQQPDDHARPRIIASSEGRRGNRSSIGVSRAAASVRSAARSLAERARGFAAVSASSGVSGRLVRMRNVGAAAIASGRWRDAAGARLRRLRKFLTMRSSSE